MFQFHLFCGYLYGTSTQVRHPLLAPERFVAKKEKKTPQFRPQAQFTGSQIIGISSQSAGTIPTEKPLSWGIRAGSWVGISPHEEHPGVKLPTAEWWLFYPVGGGGGFCELTRYERPSDIPFAAGYRYSADPHMRTNPLLTVHCEVGFSWACGNRSKLAYISCGGRTLHVTVVGIPGVSEFEWEAMNFIVDFLWASWWLGGVFFRQCSDQTGCSWVSIFFRGHLKGDSEWVLGQLGIIPLGLVEILGDLQGECRIGVGYLEFG